MSQLISNSFTSYDLTDEEALQGSIFTTLQLEVLHNQLATYAEEKIALDFDPEHSEKFLQIEAALNANIKLLNYLIDASNASLEIITTKNTNPAQGEI